SDQKPKPKPKQSKGEAAEGCLVLAGVPDPIVGASLLAMICSRNGAAAQPSGSKLPRHDDFTE
ncbi:hypothetical protein ACLEJQ_20770, partial [Pseudomonas sp. SMV71]|uniref:hypothetical protein n=1 Tax=Pseudomonas sp. SMV71 TaxID=3390195 RepID=UPI003F877151